MASVGNWVGQLTNTSGTGTLLLDGVITGYAPFSSVGDGLVWYCIITGSSKEAGIGTLSGSSLARTTVSATLVDGVVATAGAPLVLSGTSEVYCTFNKAAFDGFATNLSLASTGIRSGGLITINADPAKFDVSAGAGWVVTHSDSVSSTVVEVTWAAFTAQTLTNLATSFATDIAINASGTLLQQDSFTDIELRSLILLGGVDHSNQTDIENTFPIQRPTNSVASNVAELARAVGDINLSGNIYGANGVNLSIDKTAGVVYGYGRNNGVDSDNPSKLTTAAQTALSFGYVYDNASGAGTYVPVSTFVDPDNYDDGTGTLATVANNKYTIQRVLYFANANKTFVQYGTTVYNTLTDALDAVPRASFPLLAGIKTAMVRGYIVVKKGATDLSSADATFLSADKFGGVAGLDSGSTTASWGGITGTLSAQTDLQAELDLKADVTALNLKADATAISNIDNTSDLNKPVSTAQQTALDLKVDSVVAGTNITVDATDPNNPIVASATSAQTNATNTFTAPQLGTVTTDNDMSFDLSVTDNFTATPTATPTLTFTNIVAGKAGNIKIDNAAAAVISAASTTYITAAALALINGTGVHWLSYYSADGTNVLCSVEGSTISGGA